MDNEDYWLGPEFRDNRSFQVQIDGVVSEEAAVPSEVSLISMIGRLLFLVVLMPSWSPAILPNLSR